jgi:predicted negative regulator of RcsB-dependent stress response
MKSTLILCVVVILCAASIVGYMEYREHQRTQLVREYEAMKERYVQWMRMDQSDENYYKTKRELEKLAQAAGMPGPEAVKAEAGY